MNNNCRQNKLQRLILFERKRVNQPWVEPYRLLVNEACRHFCGTFGVKSSPVRRWQSHCNTLDRSYKYRFLNELGTKVQSYIKPLRKVCAKHVILRNEVTKNPIINMSFWGVQRRRIFILGSFAFAQDDRWWLWMTNIMSFWGMQ